ncbi:hypothetical protein M3Y95_00542800 [Aphelenchoides besseyi]|nr:hypothetical protein M3Y95_00542800 [Aphelenchoides besseyi]
MNSTKRYHLTMLRDFVVLLVMFCITKNVCGLPIHVNSTTEHQNSSQQLSDSIDNSFSTIPPFESPLVYEPERKEHSLDTVLLHIQHLLATILSILEKLLILMAIVAFLGLQYVVFKLLDRLHWWCVRRKNEPSINTSKDTMEMQDQQRY